MLSDEDRELLGFERQWWKYAGVKEAEIRRRFGIGGVRYYQRLIALTARPEVHEYDALTCKRVQRQVRERQRGRYLRRLGLMTSIKHYDTAEGRRWRVRYKRSDGRSALKRGVRPTLARSELGRGSTLQAGASRSGLAGRTDVKPSYRLSLETAWRVHVEPRWGARQIPTIRSDEVQEWVPSIDRSASVVRRAHGILADAVRARRIASNPCDSTRLPRRTTTEHRYLTWPQLLALAEASKQHRVLVLTLGLTGLRWGEATALRAGLGKYWSNRPFRASEESKNPR